MTDSADLTRRLTRHARETGFDLCGVAAATPSTQADRFEAWLAAGLHGDMTWLENRLAQRRDVRAYLPGARSVIVCAASYHVPLDPPPPITPPTPPSLTVGAHLGHSVLPTPHSTLPSPPSLTVGARLGDSSLPTHHSSLPPPGVRGRVARYALGDDYHAVLKARLHALADWLRAQTPCETKVCVDTAPVLEREWAGRAGVGWQGKNTCTIHTKLGSFVLLGEIITTADLVPDAPAVDRCGTCTRCLDACPTDALTPYTLDATRCISYWTLEHRADAPPVPADLAGKFGDWLAGCDVCQDVCPWNRKAPYTDDPAFAPRWPSGTLDAAEVADWTPDEYRRQFKGSALKRIKLPQLQRNARIVLQNARRAPTVREGGAEVGSVE